MAYCEIGKNRKTQPAINQWMILNLLSGKNPIKPKDKKAVSQINAVNEINFNLNFLKT